MTMRRLMTWLFGAFLLLLREDAFALGLLDGYHLAWRTTRSSRPRSRSTRPAGTTVRSAARRCCRAWCTATTVGAAGPM
ncbi:hypothetical protein P4234_28835 [Pseudomonas aeruginosa]|nr:hypothetical protein [Pseudomonas aeruginosa]